MIAWRRAMGTRKSKKLKVMRETLRQLTPDQLRVAHGGGAGGNNGGGGGTGQCPDEEFGIRTRKCAA
jgi:hypothetical protein